VPWNGPLKNAYIRKWYELGYGNLPQQWGDYDVHHIIPRMYGGTNDFWNLVPVLRDDHQKGFSPWWLNYDC
jgi:HNH endonuclease